MASTSKRPMKSPLNSSRTKQLLLFDESSASQTLSIADNQLKKLDEQAYVGNVQNIFKELNDVNS